MKTRKKLGLGRRSEKRDVRPIWAACAALLDYPDERLIAGLDGIAFGTDGIRDLWSPYGSGDLLGIALQYARAASVVQDADLHRVVELATRSAAGFVGLERHDLLPDARADIVLVDAENPMDALVRLPPRRLVIGSGRVLWDAEVDEPAGRTALPEAVRSPRIR